MFNLKQHKVAKIMPYEKYNRENHLGPEINDKTIITEKKLPHRTGNEYIVTEKQMKHEAEKEAQITQKQLDSAPNSKYVKHRNEFNLSVPPINVLVEKIRQKRVAEDFHTDKKPHWTQTFDEKKQQGALPKWSKNAPQHDKIVLNNDPNRFSKSDIDHQKFSKEEIKPLIGNITTADVNRVAIGIKTGQASEYDGAIMAILKLAHDERRELTDIERKTIVNLKTSRTKTLIQS